jgi:hypothetical protein
LTEKPQPTEVTEPPPSQSSEPQASTQPPVETPQINEFEEKYRQMSEKIGESYGLIDGLSDNPVKIKEMADLLATDFNDISPLHLHKMGWIEQNSFPGASQRDMESAYEEYVQNKFFGLDESDPNFGLSGLNLIEFKRTVETARTSGIQKQGKVKEELANLKSVQGELNNQQPPLSQEEAAKLQEFYLKQFEQVKVDYTQLGIPSEAATLLEPNLFKEFQSKFLDTAAKSPSLGLEEYFPQDANGQATVNFSKLMQDRFLVENFPILAKKLVEYGESVGRQKNAKEVIEKIDAPGPGHTPGGASPEPKFLTLSNGTKIPI